jgi:hypothetical protein
MSKKQNIHPTQQKIALLLRWLRAEYTIKSVIPSSEVQGFCKANAIPSNYVFFLKETNVLMATEVFKVYKRATYNINGIPELAKSIHSFMSGYYRDANQAKKLKDAEKQTKADVVAPPDLFSQVNPDFSELIKAKKREEEKDASPVKDVADKYIEDWTVTTAIEFLKRSGYKVYRVVQKTTEEEC